MLAAKCFFPVHFIKLYKIAFLLYQILIFGHSYDFLKHCPPLGIKMIIIIFLILVNKCFPLILAIFALPAFSFLNETNTLIVMSCQKWVHHERWMLLGKVELWNKHGTELIIWIYHAMFTDVHQICSKSSLEWKIIRH